uniref:Mitochondrial carrier protein n=1 Tax=Rhabditophanes sp. KR3021 TaxID=114890 RepID=A0AC35UBH3_9BILA
MSGEKDQNKSRSEVGSITVKQQMIAAGVGAGITSLTMTPMDVVKIRLQRQMHAIPREECFLYYNGLMEHVCSSCKLPNTKQIDCQWFDRPGNFRGTFDAFRKIVKNEGIFSLWSGLPPTIVSAIPTTVLYYSAYDQINLYLQKHLGDYSLIPLFSGSFARFVVVTAVAPIEMIRTKMQSEALSYKNVRQAMMSTIKSDGIRSLWRGWSATVVRDIPFSGIYWCSYEFLNKSIRKWRNQNEKTFVVNAFCGFVCGGLAGALTTPFDVVKTHKEITLGSGKSKTTITSTREALGSICRLQGASKLFTGIVPRIAKVSPACAIMISCYEYFKSYFAGLNTNV